MKRLPVEHLLAPPAVCAILNVSERWLERQRQAGKGPRHIKAGKHVRYPESGLREWIQTGDATIARGASHAA